VTIDPIFLTRGFGAVVDPHWIEVEAHGPGHTNVLVIAGGIGIMAEGLLDTEGSDDSARSHIYIETGYEFGDGDAVGDLDLVGSAQLASVALDGSDDFTFEIVDVAALKMTPEEIASLQSVGISGDNASITGGGPRLSLPTRDALVVKVTYSQSGIVSTFRLGYSAAVRVYRVDPSRVVRGWKGDAMDATQG